MTKEENKHYSNRAKDLGVSRVFEYVNTFTRERVVAVVLVLSVMVSLFSFTTPTQAATGLNEQLNFQARLLNSDGSLVDDGNYHVRFKIYRGGDGALGGGDETQEWTEAHSTGNLVRVANGYLSVQLNSITDDFSTVSWNDDTLWLSMEIGGTAGAASWDGEMDPFMRLGSVPQAFNSQNLEGRRASEFVQLDPGAIAQAVNSANTAINVNQTGAGDLLSLESGGSAVLTVENNGNVAIGAATAPSKLFVYQDNSSVGTDAGITVAQDGTGDALVQYLLTGTKRWVTGIDNSDGDSYKIAASANLGTDTIFALNDTGLLTLGNSSLNGVIALHDGVGNTATIETVAALGANVTYQFGAAAAGTYEICTDEGNCAGVGGVGDILDGGNTNGAGITIGTNDNFSLGFKTNGYTIGGFNSAGSFNINDPSTVASVSLNAYDGALELESGNNSGSYIDFKGSANLLTDYQGRISYNDGTGFSIATDEATGASVRILENGTTIIDNQANVADILNLRDNNVNVLEVRDGGDLAVDTDTFFVDASANNVGIGTDTPGSKLSVLGQDATFYSGTTQQRLSIGRNAAEDLEFYVDDENGYIILDQDETSGVDHNLIFNIDSPSTEVSNYIFQVAGAAILDLSETGRLSVGNGSTAGLVSIYDGSSHTGTIATQSLTANRTYTFPNQTGTVCLTSGNCAGVGGTGDILDGGNTNTAPVSVGTTDAFGFDLLTSGVSRLSLDAAGLLTVSNDATFNGNITQDGIGITDGSGFYRYKDLLYSRNGSSSVTGALVIETNIPKNVTGHWISDLEFDVYQYAGGNEASEYNLSTYNYYTAAGPVSSFPNNNVTREGSLDADIRLAENASGNISIIIGETGDNWNRPQVSVTGASSSNATDSYFEGWTLSTGVTSLASYSNIASVSTDNRVEASTLEIGGQLFNTLTGAGLTESGNALVVGAGSCITASSTAIAVTGNCVDAATLDGLDSTDFFRENLGSVVTDFDNYTATGSYLAGSWIANGVANGPSGAYGWGQLRVTQFNGDTYVTQEYLPHQTENSWTRTRWGGTWTAWRETWGSGNDGAGSGLDADLLDGQSSAFFQNASNLSTGIVPIARGGTGSSTLNNLIVLGTHTSGNYLATATGNSQIAVSGSGGESAGITLSVVADSIGDSQLAFNTGQHLTVTSTPEFDGLTVGGTLTFENGETISNATDGALTVNGHLYPSADNTYDIGQANGTNEWRNAFFDGTVRTDGLTVDGNANFVGGDLYDSSADISLRGEDNVIIAIDYNSNDADTRYFSVVKNTPVNDFSTTNELFSVQEAGDVNVTIGNLDINTGSLVLGSTNLSEADLDALDNGTITLNTETTGILSAANGGTGTSSLNNLITLGSHTIGNYLATATGNSQIAVSGSGGESAGITLSVVANSIGDSQLTFNTGQHLTVTSSPTFDDITITDKIFSNAGSQGFLDLDDDSSAGADNEVTLTSLTNINIIIDSNNNDADNREFTISKNNTAPDSATALFIVQEGGNASLLGDLTVTGGNLILGSTNLSEADLDALDNGTITLGVETTGTLGISNGGTGATTALTALGNLDGTRRASTENSVHSSDTRATNEDPEDRDAGLYVDFKQNSANGLSDGGTYNGVLSFRKYGAGADFSGGVANQLGFTENGNLWMRNSTSATTWGSWLQFWGEGNDGSGSGLDADLLDGQSSAYFRNASNINAGTLSVSRGGTGSGSFTAGGVVYGNGTSPLTASAAGTAGECLKSGGAGAPTWSSCASGAVTGSGTINTIALFTSTGSLIGDSIITQSGTNASVAGSLSVVGSLGTIATSSTGNDLTFSRAGGNYITATNAAGTIQLGTNDDLSVIVVQADEDVAIDGDTLFVDTSASSVGIGTITPSTNLEISSAGDAAIRLTADTLNGTEDNNAYIEFSQDVNVIRSVLGTVGNAGRDPTNTAYTDTIVNSTLLGTTTAGAPLQLGTNSAVALTIATNQRVGIGDTTPDAILDVEGAGDQLRLSYNNTNYTRFTTNSSGVLSVIPTGGLVNITGDLDVLGHGAYGASVAVSDSYILNVSETLSEVANVIGIRVNVVNDADGGGTLSADNILYGINVAANNTSVEDIGGGFDSDTYGGYFTATASAARTFRNLTGGYNRAYVTSDAASNQGNAIGTLGTVQFNSNDAAAVLPNAYGVQGYVQGSTTGGGVSNRINNARGLYGVVYPYETNITTAYASYNRIQTINGYGGDITTAYGTYNTIRVDSDDGGNITNAYAGRFDINKRAGANNVTTGYGLYVNVDDSTNAYGARLYVDDADAVSNYGIRISVDNASSTNYAIFIDEGDIVLDADGNGGVGGTGPGGDFALGEGNDLRLYHNGTDSYIQNNTGLLRLNSAAGISVGGPLAATSTVQFSALNCTGNTNGGALTADASGNVTCSNDDGGGTPTWTTTGSDIYYNTGNVGIGTTGPTAALEVVDTAPNAANGSSVLIDSTLASTTNSQQGLWVDVTYAPGSSAGSVFPIALEVDLTSSSTNIGGADLIGFESYVKFSGAGTTADSLNAGSFLTQVSGTSGATSLKAGYFQNRNTGSGTVANAYGVQIAGATNSGGGTITSNYGVYVANQTAGTTDIGVYVQGADTYGIYVNAGDVRINDDLAVYGDSTLQNNSTSALAVNNNSAESVLRVNTTTGDGIITSDFTSTVTSSGTTETLTNYALTADRGTATAVGADGVPVFAYYQSGSLTFRRCTDAECAATGAAVTLDATSAVIDNDARVDMAIASDGFPIIAYLDDASDDLNVYDCDNAGCTSGTVRPVDTSGARGQHVSIVVPADNLPVITHMGYDGGTNRFWVTKCGNASCSSGNSSTQLGSGVNSSRDIGLDIGSNGFPFIAYIDFTGSGSTNDVRAISCSNAACSSSTNSLVGNNVGGDHPAPVVGLDGIPVIGFRGPGGFNLITCDNSTCTSASTSSISGSGAPYYDMDSILNADGIPMWVFRDAIADNGTADLAIAACDSLSCADATITLKDGAINESGSYASIALKDDGMPFITHITRNNNDIRVISCVSVDCISTTSSESSTVGGVQIGESTKIFKGIYVATFNDGDDSSYFQVTNTGQVKIKNFGVASATHVCRDTATGELTKCSSNRRYKNNIQDLTLDLDTIRSLTPRQFDWRANGTADLGFIAEEVESVNPLLAQYEADGSLSGVKYSQMSALLVQGIKELDVQVQDIDVRLATIEAALNGTLNVVNLTVSGTAQFTGDLMVHQNATIKGNLAVEGHVITAGDVPDATVSIPSDVSSVVEITGTDTAGTITFTLDAASTGSVLGAVAEIEFVESFSGDQSITFTPVGLDAAQANAYVDDVDAEGFTLNFANSLSAGETYVINYQIIDVDNSP